MPTAARVDYSEQIVWMPYCYLGNQSWQPIEPGALQRRQAGLPDQGFVFCSFINSYKITPDVFDIWMRLLGKVDGSVLMLLGPNETVRKNLQSHAQERGVAPARLRFMPQLA